MRTTTGDRPPPAHETLSEIDTATGFFPISETGGFRAITAAHFYWSVGRLLELLVDLPVRRGCRCRVSLNLRIDG